MDPTAVPHQGPKLRDSCNACSSSKVKCNRAKPVCARCAKRGLLCEYLVTRRAGRKHDGSKTRMSATVQTCWRCSSTPKTPPSLFQQPQSQTDYSDLFLNLDPSESALLQGFDGAALMPSPGLRFPTYSPSAFHDSLSLFGSEDAAVDFMQQDGGASCSPSGATPAACECLSHALDHFKQLLRPLQSMTAGFVVAQNARTIDEVDKMLRCSCSRDGFLLAVVSLIMFKVLELYAATARGDVPASEQPAHHGEDQGRMTAQLVLSELHRVQQLIKALPKPKGHEMVDPSPSSRSSSNTELSFSFTVLHQLEVDLGKRLRQVSLEIVDILRER